jgi:hypothetical protein
VGGRSYRESVLFGAASSVSVAYNTHIKFIGLSWKQH